jgi:oligopeptide transport system substrate-binding protein
VQKKYAFIPFAAVAAMLFLLTSCEEQKNTNAKVFRYNQSSGISSLDPAFSKDQATIWACNQLFNGLVQLDDSLNVIPAIADSWEISDSGKTYTFKLRNDVFFHENKCFANKNRKANAFDFKYSFERIIDAKTASPGTWIFSEHIDSLSPFAALDSFTFQIKLRKPFLPLMGILTMQYCSVIPQEAVAYYGQDFRANPVGTGPFQLKKWREGIALILVKNENYFEKENGQSLPYIDGVRVSFITDKKSEFLSFRQKEIDFISGLDASYIDEVLTENGTLKEALSGEFNLSKSPYLNTEYLGFNLADNLYNKNVRQAVNMAIDRAELIKYLRNGIGKPAVNGFVPFGLPSFDESEVFISYNPEKAVELLKASGAYDSKKPVTLYTNETYREIGLMVAKQLSKVGLDVKLEVNPGAVLREWMVKGKAPFFRGSWIADYPDAESYYAVFYSKNGTPPNYTRFANKEFDKIYELALRETDNSKRYLLYKKLDVILNEETPVIPLYYDEVLLFSHKNIKGLSTNALNLLQLKRMKID